MVREGGSVDWARLTVLEMDRGRCCRDRFRTHTHKLDLLR